MSGCFDKFSCECCDSEAVKEWLKKTRNTFASIIGGSLFAIGWWFVVDAVVDYSEPIYAAYFLPGIFSTIALLMINSISTQQITNDSLDDTCFGKRVARVWLFIGFFFAFGGVVGGLWIFIQAFLVPAVVNDGNSSSNSTNTTVSPSPSPSPLPSSSNPDCFPCIWQGLSFFLQNLFIFAGSLVFKFGRSEDDDSF